MSKGHGSKTAVYAALVANTIITIMKFAVAIMSGSSAMLAESYHSVADTGNQALLLLGISRSKKPPDKLHPFGYGKAQYFWSFVVANMIFMIGAVAAFYEGIHKIKDPHPIEKAYLIYIVLGVAFVIEGASLIFAITEFIKQKGDMGVVKELKASKDSSLIVVLMEDSAACLGLLIAFVGTLVVQLTGIQIIDGLTSIVIGVLLAAVALFLANEMRKLLIGERASKHNLKLISQAVNSFPQVESLIGLYTMHMGPDSILVAMDIEFRDGLTTDELEGLIDRIEQKVKESVPDVKQIFLEAETLSGEDAPAEKKPGPGGPESI